MGQIQRFKKYLTDVRAELNRVVWPTRRDTTTTTFVVISMVISVSLFLWLVDTLLGMLVHAIIG